MNLTQATEPQAPPAKESRPSLRIGELDALRGIAAFSVIFHHLTRRFFEDYGRPPEAWGQFPFSGLHGVFLFFIISGFVITHTLERTRSAREFVVSRFSRIYPSFWVCVLLTWSAVQIFGLPGRERSVGEAAVNLTMMQDHFHVAQVDYVYWSLTIEVTFYALALIAHLRGWLFQRPHLCAWVWLTFSALMLVLREAANFKLPVNVALLTLPSFAPLFVAGFLFHRLHSGRGSAQTYVALACCYLLHNEWNWHGKSGLVLSAGMFATFFLLAAHKLRFLSVPPLLFLGAISYPLYLLHNNLGMVLIRQGMSLGMNYNLSLILAVVAILGLSAAVTFLVERPAMRWIRGRRAAAQTRASGP